MIVWGRGGRFGQLLSWPSFFKEMRSVLQPHARTKLSYLSMCGFRLKLKYFYSEVTLTSIFIAHLIQEQECLYLSPSSPLQKWGTLLTES